MENYTGTQEAMLEDIFDVIMHNTDYITSEEFGRKYCNEDGFRFEYDGDENKILVMDEHKTYEITIKETFSNI